MFESVKFGLFDIKREVLLSVGLLNDDIKPFDQKLYDKLGHYYFDGLPLSMHVRYGVPKMFNGRCDIRSKFLYFGVDNAKLVWGFRKDLEYKVGNREDSWHYWVEDDEWVYDPTTLHMYKKDIYYKAHGVSDMIYFSEEEAKEEEYIELISATTIEDYYPDGKRRYELLQTVPFMQFSAQSNKDLEKELNAFLETVSYDEARLLNELHSFISEEVKELAKKGSIN